MTQERINLLESIGMIWDAQRGGNRQRDRIRSIACGVSAVELPVNVKVDQRAFGDVRSDACSNRTKPVSSVLGFRAQEGSQATAPSAYSIGVATTGSFNLARSVSSPPAARPFLPSGLHQPAGFSMATISNQHWTSDAIRSAMSQGVRFGNGMQSSAGVGATASPTAILQALTGIRRNSYMFAQGVMNTNAINDDLRNLAASIATPFGSHAPTSILNRTNSLLAYRQLESMAEQSLLQNRAQTPLGFGFDSGHENLSRYMLARYGISDHASLHHGSDISGGRSLLSHIGAAGLLGLNRGGHLVLGENMNLSQYRQARVAAAIGMGSQGISLRETAFQDIVMNGLGATGREPPTGEFENEKEDEQADTTRSHVRSDGT
jgi:hypothetical protein